jgi:Putative adhesin
MRGLFVRGLAGLSLGAAFLLTGCIDGDFGGAFEHFREDFHFSYPLAAGGTIQLDTFNGGVEISGWDKDLIEIDGTKYASTESRMKQIKIDVSQSANSITIHTSHPLERFGNAGAKFVLHVPNHVELSNITSSNGAIKIEDIEGHSHLRTSNGGIHVMGLKGSLDAETSNGAVDISDVAGNAVIRTSNGSIHAEVKKGNFDAHTTNGSITARLLEADDRPVRLQSSNGHIEVTMDAAREVRADTSNSSITVRMPGSIGANVRAHTSNSSISSDFDVNVHSGSISKHSLEGTIGAGGPTLDLETTNGSIKLVRF